MREKLIVTFNNAAKCKLDDFIDDIKIVWNKLDPERSLYDTWLHTVNHASSFGEAVRRGHYKKILDEIANTIMWFLTFVGKLQQSPKERIIKIEEERLMYTSASLTDIIWSKYPYICPVCFFRYYQNLKEEELANKKCDCLLYPREVETRNELLSSDEEDRQKAEKLQKVQALQDYATQNDSRKPNTVGDLQDMFEHIYQANIDNSSLESIAFHLLEEIGEVSDALIRIYTYKQNPTPPSEEYPQRIENLESELADVTSWIFTVCLKVKYLCNAHDELRKETLPPAVRCRYEAISTSINFWEILWLRYGHPDGKSLWCPICREVICSCSVDFANEEEKQQKMGLVSHTKQ